jgi:hypothetical protein
MVLLGWAMTGIGFEMQLPRRSGGGIAKRHKSNSRLWLIAVATTHLPQMNLPFC